MNSRVDKVQPLWMELLQAIAFSNIVDSLKVMSLTPHACSKFKSLDYGAIIIEFVNRLPTKLNGDILLELLPFFFHWDNSNNCKVWTESSMFIIGVSCRPLTLRICLNWASKQ